MINWDRVRELRDEVGHEDFGEIVELFLEEVEEVICRLQERADPGTLEEDFHFLKGSALNLGFRDFGGHCQAGERAARENAGPEQHLGLAIDSFFVSKAEFLSNLEQRLAA